MSASVKSTQQPAEQVPVVYAPPPAYWSPPEDDTIDLLELLQTLWRWRWLIVVLMVAGLLGSYAVVQVLPKKYTASVIYYAPKGGVSDEIKRVAGDPRFLMSLVQSQNLAPLLLGDALDPVTGQFREANPLSPEEAAAGVLLDEKSKVIEFGTDARGNLLLTIQLPDPERAAQLANTFLQEAETWAKQSISTRNALEIETLEKQALQVQERKDQVLKSLLAFSNKHPDVLVNTADSSMVGMQERLTEVQVELVLSEEPARIKLLQSQEARLESAIAEARQQQQQAALLKQEFQQMEKELQSAMELSVEVSKGLETKKTELSTLLAQSTEILSTARAPEEPSSPRTRLIIALSGIVALFAGVFLAFFIEFVQNLRKPAQEP